MRICSSVGSVSIAVPLVGTAISFLLLLEVFQDVIQSIEAFRPGALVTRNPVVNRLERTAVQPVEPLPSALPHVDRAHFPEHPEVLRHLRLGEPEQLYEVVHGTF